ncbi:MAG: LysR family transcriptional regulator [Lawsonibacter sp.]|nr:LysR family transcriptional regulator [Lawsonibacter sp.]MCI8914437.1 LysR family transcriptional regulator [Lawsonibacter sp.]
MNLKDAMLTLALFEERSVTSAAKRIGYTESGASHIIKKLEQELGFSLFVRTRKGLVPTPNGERMLPHIRRIVTAYEFYTEEASAIRGVQEGHIAIASYTSAAIHWLPAGLEQFHAAFPNITVEIREGDFNEIESWLEEGAVDLAITEQNRESKMDWFPLKLDTYLAVCSPESPYAHVDVFDLRELEHTPCVLAYSVDPDLYTNLNPLGIRPNQIISAHNELTMMSIVGQNLAVAVLPELFLRGYQGNNILLPTSPHFERELGIRVPSLKEASPAAQHFFQCLRDTIQQIEDKTAPPYTFGYSTHTVKL